MVITTDIGTEMDDQWTVASVALAPEFDLKGVVTTHVPNMPWPPADNGAVVARDVMEHLPLAHRRPVCTGSNTPLSDAATPAPSDGMRLILEASRGYSPQQRLQVLVLGPATDVASALLTDPTLQDRIGVVGMAFNNERDGQDNWNVLNDIPSWQVVLRSTVPVTIGSGEVTQRDLQLSCTEARQLLAERGPLGAYLADMHNQFVLENPEMAEESTGKRDTWPVWDEVAPAYLLGMTEHVDVPRPVLQDGGGFAPGQHGSGTLRSVTRIDREAIFGRLAHDVQQAQVVP